MTDGNISQSPAPAAAADQAAQRSSSFACFGDIQPTSSKLMKSLTANAELQAYLDDSVDVNDSEYPWNCWKKEVNDLLG